MKLQFWIEQIFKTKDDLKTGESNNTNEFLNKYELRNEFNFSEVHEGMNGSGSCAK